MYWMYLLVRYYTTTRLCCYIYASTISWENVFDHYEQCLSSHEYILQSLKSICWHVELWAVSVMIRNSLDVRRTQTMWWVIYASVISWHITTYLNMSNVYRLMYLTDFAVDEHADLFSFWMYLKCIDYSWDIVPRHSFEVGLNETMCCYINAFMYECIDLTWPSFLFSREYFHKTLKSICWSVELWTVSVKHSSHWWHNILHSFDFGWD